MRDDFIATLTHDLKVPIIAEKKVLELLLKETFGKLQTTQKEALNNMLANNNDMMTLVTTLLDVYKLEDGVFEIQTAKCDVLEILNNEVDKLKYISKEKKWFY